MCFQYNKNTACTAARRRRSEEKNSDFKQNDTQEIKRNANALCGDNEAIPAKRWQYQTKSCRLRSEQYRFGNELFIRIIQRFIFRLLAKMNCTIDRHVFFFVSLDSPFFYFSLRQIPHKNNSNQLPIYIHIVCSFCSCYFCLDFIFSLYE